MIGIETSQMSHQTTLLTPDNFKRALFQYLQYMVLHSGLNGIRIDESFAS